VLSRRAGTPRPGRVPPLDQRRRSRRRRPPPATSPVHHPRPAPRQTARSTPPAVTPRRDARIDPDIRRTQPPRRRDAVRSARTTAALDLRRGGPHPNRSDRPRPDPGRGGRGRTSAPARDRCRSPTGVDGLGSLTAARHDCGPVGVTMIARDPDRTTSATGSDFEHLPFDNVGNDGRSGGDGRSMRSPAPISIDLDDVDVLLGWIAGDTAGRRATMRSTTAAVRPRIRAHRCGRHTGLHKADRDHLTGALPH